MSAELKLNYLREATALLDLYVEEQSLAISSTGERVLTEAIAFSLQSIAQSLALMTEDLHSHHPRRAESLDT